MKKIFKLILITAILYLGSFVTSCSDKEKSSSSQYSINEIINVSKRKFEVVKIELKSNKYSKDELDAAALNTQTRDLGKTIIFMENGVFGEEGTLKSLYTSVPLNTWSQFENILSINGENNIFPVKAYIDGNKVICEIGDISYLLVVYTFEEVK